jgi:E3 ubiquitin-protein ligase TRIP12
MAALRKALLVKKDAAGAAAAAAEIDALTLEWTMPGSGAAIDRHCAPVIAADTTQAESTRVDADSLDAYITAVSRVLLCDGIAGAADAFLRGLGAFSPAPTLMLSLLEPHEWQEVISGGAAIADEEAWSFSALRAALRPGPRYSSSSVQLDWLSTAVSRLTAPRKKLFLRFISGAPRVPAGGLRLSVTAVDAANVDTLLPSCATCTLTLKLPRYSSLDVLEAKLLLAITEGQEAFALD